MNRFGERAFFATIEEAVSAFLVSSPAPGDAGRFVRERSDLL
jgi:hypothetical protein